jgi:hypothetical protein
MAAQLPLKPSDIRKMCGQMWEGFVMSPQRAEYHSSLRRKYERAACYPWLPIEPDPPLPRWQP